MKMTNVLSKAKNPVLSLEITPPDRGRSVDELFSAIEGLMDFAPKFISVTYHQPHTVYEEVNGIIRRRPKRKKPGTVGISAAIKNRYGVTTIPHLICGGFDRFETEDALIDLHYLGMKNILALRGDPLHWCGWLSGKARGSTQSGKRSGFSQTESGCRC